MQEKRCTKCKTIRPISSFGKTAKVKSGLRSQCKDCERAYCAGWREANPDYQDAYYARNKSKLLARMAQRYAENPQPFRERSRIWAENNQEASKAIQRRWLTNNHEMNRQKSHRRRVRQQMAGTYQVSKDEIHKLSRGSCFYCGSVERIEIDHVMPLSRGGTHSIGNLVSACLKCNRSKGSKTITEWRRARIGN